MKILLLVPPYIWLGISAILFAAGEYLSKSWVNSPSTGRFLLTTAAWTLSGIVWLPALLHRNELSVMGTAYLVLGTIGTVLIGICFYQEPITAQRICGISLAIVGMILLS